MNPYRVGWTVATALWAGFILFGSWYPFRFQAGSFADAWAGWLAAGGDRQSTPDVAVNFFLGVPFGFLGWLAANPRGAGRRVPRSHWHWLSALVVLVAIFAWALLVELGQHWFGRRVPSASDTFAQLFGGVVGVSTALACGDWVRQRAEALAGDRGQQSRGRSLLELYLAGYAAWVLMPFLPALTPSVLARRWRSGRIQPLPAVGDWLTNPLEQTYTAAVASVTALPIGWYFVTRFGNSRERAAWVPAILAAALFVVGLEAAQVFVETRTATADDAIWSAVGAAVGVALAWRFGRADGDTTGRSAAKHSARRWSLALALVAYGMISLAVAWAPFDVIDSGAEIRARISGLVHHPLSSTFAGNDLNNVSNLLRCALWALPLGALVRLANLVAPPRHRLIVGIASGLWALMILGLMEVGQLFLRDHHPSLVDFAARLCGCLAGTVVVRMVAGARPRSS